MFICNHCPFVKNLQTHLAATAKEYSDKGVQFIAISANDAEAYPQDGPDKMAEEAEKFAYCFPYLYDETQEVAKAYQAEATPDFFVFDKNLSCVYRGRYDESTPNNGTVTGEDLRAALDAMIAGEPVKKEQYPSVGCNIKWRDA